MHVVTERWNEARSVHIGLNRVDSGVYAGWLPDLASAEEDAREMRDLANSMGCSARTILSEDATREDVASALESVVERLRPGDFLMITYSGHMTTIPGIGDDPDGWDEAWCLHDGILLDDEFHDLLAAAPEGTDVLVVTDSCFAAGLVDRAAHQPGPAARTAAGPPRRARRTIRPRRDYGLPTAARDAAGADSPKLDRALERMRAHCARAGLPAPEVLHRARATDLMTARAPVRRVGDIEVARLVAIGAIPRGRSRPTAERRPIAARVVALSAAAEGSPAYEGEALGLFTAALLDVVEGLGPETASYEEVLDAVSAKLRIQSPSIGIFGSADLSVLDAPAFRAQSAAPVPEWTGERLFGHLFDEGADVPEDASPQEKAPQHPVHPDHGPAGPE